MCPYYSQSGFCPRQQFCKFRHDRSHDAKSRDQGSLEDPSEDFSKLAIHGQPQILRSISSPGTYTPSSTDEVRTKIDYSSDDINITRSHDINERGGRGGATPSVTVNEFSPDDVEEGEREGEEEEGAKGGGEEGGIEDVVVKRKRGLPNIYDTASPEELEVCTIVY